MSNAPQTKTSKQEGFSLLELLLVIGVGAVLLIAGISVYRMVTRDSGVNEVMRTVMSVKSGVQRLYLGEKTYGVADLLPSLITADIFPGNVHIDPATPAAFHPLGGSLEINGTGSAFTISIYDLDQGPCISLGSALNPDTEDDMLSLEVDSGSVTTFDLSNPATPADLATACGASGNALHFTFM